MTNSITPKQDKFARLVAEGKGQTEAYRTAYNCSRMKDKTIHNNAYKLSLDNGVTTRIKEIKEKLRKESDIASTITLERQIKYTQLVIQQCNEKGDHTNYLKALDMQNKLIGLYAPTKNENRNINLTPEDLIKQLDDE